MSSTSTNKQPLLIDRVFLEVVDAGAAPALTTSTNLRTPAPAGMTLLLTPGSDGSVIDSITVTAPQASITASNLLVFVSTVPSPVLITAANTRCIRTVAIGSASMGQVTNVPLPPLSVPVPNLASPAATMATYPSETDKKNTGLYVPSGKYIYVGTDVALFASAVSTSVIVTAQGGHF
ncbi:MAG: hypothetical protein VKI63_06065 [Cyanobium sp.]|nr:hypothetical protein [Cyanobium sp.]